MSKPTKEEIKQILQEPDFYHEMKDKLINLFESYEPTEYDATIYAEEFVENFKSILVGFIGRQ